MSDRPAVILMVDSPAARAVIMARMVAEFPDENIMVVVSSDPTIPDGLPENVLTMKRYGNAYPEIMRGDVPVMDPALMKRAYVDHNDKRPSFLKGAGARITSARHAR